MTKKPTQKEVVKLFNQEAAPFQHAVANAYDAYEKALTLFAITHLGVTRQEWQEYLMDREGMYRDSYFVDNDDDVEPWKICEYAVRHLIIEMDENAEDWHHIREINNP